MTDMKINIEGAEHVGTYKFSFKFDSSALVPDTYSVRLEVFVDSRSEEFFVQPDIGVRDKKGIIRVPFGIGKTQEKAIEFALKQLHFYIHSNFVDELPKFALVNLNAKKQEEVREYQEQFYKYFGDKMYNWRDFTLRRNVKEGFYIEFQLEHDGTYLPWHEDSLYIGEAILNSVRDVFCLIKYGFDQFGRYVFSLSELPQLKEKIVQAIEQQKNITSLSAFLDTNSVRANELEPNVVTWKELRDAIVEFLLAVSHMIEQGIKEQRAMFVLGL